MYIVYEIYCMDHYMYIIIYIYIYLCLQETLTGFKWMGNKAVDLMKQGKTVLFAFEEAIGKVIIHTHTHTHTHTFL